MKKLISLLLALVLVMSLIPMTVLAADVFRDDKTGKWYELDKSGDISVEITDPDRIEKLDASYKEWLIAQEEQLAAANHEPNDHTYGINYNTKYHWLECACGAKISMELHIDPKDAEDDYCTCGYHFSDNADLVTLWINGCPPIKGFNKDKTEYELKAYTYKDVKEIKVSTRTFDSEATVELPEDLTLKEGENKFEIKVTAENQKVTKIYTVTITKESK